MGIRDEEAQPISRDISTTAVRIIFRHLWVVHSRLDTVMRMILMLFDLGSV